MKVKNIHGEKINVQSKPLLLNEIREVEYDNEIRKLVMYGYLEVIEK